MILNAEASEAKLHRMALEVAECLSVEDRELIIIGIRNNGVFIADRIAFYLQNEMNGYIKTIQLTMDKKQPTQILLSENISLANKNILIVDDVSNSGKTLLYALKPLLDQYPNRIQTLVLVERMHKLFPVKPDFVGLSIATSDTDYIEVENNNGSIEAVLIQ